MMYVVNMHRGVDHTIIYNILYSNHNIYTIIHLGVVAVAPRRRRGRRWCRVQLS
jgi:hypothetical protein